MEKYTEEELELLEGVYYADFETTTKRNFDEEGEVRVYMCGLMSADGEEYYTGTRLNKFMREISHNIASIPDTKISIWFHNLKFDFSFIENYLLSKGTDYKVRSDIKPWLSFGNEYMTTRDDMNNLYGTTWLLGEKRYVNFKDTAKIFPTTIKALGPSVGLEKLDEQFDYEQLIDEYYQPTESDYEYMYNDIEIIRRAMNRQIIEEGGERLTRTGYAFNGLKRKYNEDNQDETWDPVEHGLDKNQTLFDYHFPATSPQEYQQLSRAYSGGIVYVQEESRNKELGETLVLDVNSEYPGAMIKYDFPIYDGMSFEGPYNLLPENLRSIYPLYVQYFTAEFKLKEDGFPSLPKIYGKKRGTVYSSDDLDPIKGNRLVLTNVDIHHFFKNYDVWNIKYEGGVAWQSIHAPFKGYIDEQADKKIQSELDGDMVGRFMYKSNMNGCYGKFAQKPNRGSKDSYLDENGVVRFTERLDEPEAQQYFPMAIFIAAWARNILLEGVYAAGVDRVLYIDTDSIHLKGWEIPEDLPVHDTKLGYWSLEGKAVNAKFLRDKTYVEDMIQKDGSTELDYKIAGLNDEAKELIGGLDNFMLGKAYPGVLVSRQVKGGTLLVDGSKYLTPTVVRNPHSDEMERHEEYMNRGKQNNRPE